MNKIVSLFSQSHRSDPFESLIAPYIKGLHQQAYRLTGDMHEAEELLQDFLADAFAKRKHLQAADNPPAWLNRCLYHRFVDRYRKKQRRPDFDDIDHPHTAEQLTARSDLDRDQMHRQIVKAMDKLSPKQRAVVSLHDQAGFSLPELESILDMPLGTLKSHLHRGRLAVRKQLGLDKTGKPQQDRSGDLQEEQR